LPFSYIVDDGEGKKRKERAKEIYFNDQMRAATQFREKKTQSTIPSISLPKPRPELFHVVVKDLEFEYLNFLSFFLPFLFTEMERGIAFLVFDADIIRCLELSQPQTSSVGCPSRIWTCPW
jgi:hypothetical protein